MLKWLLFVIVSVAVICSCQRVIGDPIGFSDFYVINKSADSISIRAIQRDYSESTFKVKSNDTVFIGTFSEFSPPRPTQCFDTLFTQSLVTGVRTNILIDNDSQWVQIHKEVSYPQRDGWYLKYP